jgi:GDP-L-fucose synthase
LSHPDLVEQRILVTGGAGFLGSAVCRQLQELGCRHVTVPRSRDHDLRDPAQVERLFAHVRPQVVVHLAAVVGGIGANRKHPGRFFYDNATMGLHVIEQARRSGVERFVCVGTICSYPKAPPLPFRESDLWNGYPEETNAPYGLAKRMLLVQLQAYREEYGLKSAFVIPTNLYGPGDHADLETSHVIPALIRKCVEAKQRGDDSVAVWGSGSATREFLYVDDAAQAIVQAARCCDDPEPLNLGSGTEISIRALVERIAELVGFEGQLVWDTSKPDGQPRRLVDSGRARDVLGWSAQTPFEQGLAATVAWYQRLWGGPRP